MEATVLTLSFDLERKCFPREELEDFCMNKIVHSVEGNFFEQDGHPYWTVLIRYERVLAKENSLEQLSPAEKLAYEKLRLWRKEKAEEEGYPAFLVATNKQLVRMIQKRVRNKHGFDEIKGFGRKRIQKYGTDILIILNSFFKHE